MKTAVTVSIKHILMEVFFYVSLFPIWNADKKE